MGVKFKIKKIYSDLWVKIFIYVSKRGGGSNWRGALDGNITWKPLRTPLAALVIAFLAKLCMYNTMSITGSNVSNMCEFNINMSDIINGTACNIMKIAYTGFNALRDEQWKCDMILELTDCIYMVLATVV